MKVFLGFLFLLVNIVATSTGQSNTIIAFILLCICISFVFVSKKKGNSFLISLIELLCYTWSSSWRNIFGGSFADTPVPWFYLVGLMAFLYVTISKRLILKREIFLLLGLLITLGLIPLMIAPYFSEAIKEYVTLLFFYIIIGAVLFAKISIKENEYFSILKSFVYSNVISSVFIICQFITQHFWGYDFVNNSQPILLGGRRMLSTLLFDDISSATICLGLGVIIVNMDLKRFKHPYFITGCIVGGMALSSARTGFITVIITFILYIIFSKNSVNKFKVMLVSLFAGLIGIIAFFVVRDVSTVEGLLNDNGRFDGYLAALNIWLENPIFGVGFGDNYLSQLMQMAIPHFSLLKILTQTGIIYTFFLVLLLIYFYKMSLRSNYIYGKYMLLNSLIGSLFIPGLFSARFFTIVISIICLQNKVIINDINEKYNYIDTYKA